MHGTPSGTWQSALLTLMAAAIPAVQAAPAATHGNDGQSLRITGAIDGKSADTMIAFIDGGGRSIVIDSEGGDAEAGLRIADRLQQSEVEVVVNQYCFSSCANYVFVPARSKRLNEGAVLGFHGGLVDTRMIDTRGMAPATRALFEMMARNYKKQAALFERIGVDQALLGGAGKLASRLASTPAYALTCGDVDSSYTSEKAWKRALAACGKRKRNYSFSTLNGLETTVYFPSRQTLERHGVRGIGAYPYPAGPAAMREVATGLGFRIDLVGDVE
ncbi:MAG: hypothetical protein ACREWI_00665 [Telluria sp.]